MPAPSPQIPLIGRLDDAVAWLLVLLGLADWTGGMLAAPWAESAGGVEPSEGGAGGVRATASQMGV